MVAGSMGAGYCAPSLAVFSLLCYTKTYVSTGWLHLGLICLAPIFLNNTPVWTDRDSQAFTRALYHCEEKYKNSPCLSSFVKTKPLTYRAMCKDPFYFTRNSQRQIAFEAFQVPLDDHENACRVIHNGT